jgi:hypothetical protein
MTGAVTSLHGVVRELVSRKVPTARGGQWTPVRGRTFERLNKTGDFYTYHAFLSVMIHAETVLSVSL